MFQRNLVTRSVPEDEQEDEDRLELEQPRDEEESRHQGLYSINYSLSYALFRFLMVIENLGKIGCHGKVME